MKRFVIIIVFIAVFLGSVHLADWVYGQDVVPGGTWYFQFLHDSPGLFAGQATKHVRVNAAGTKLEYVTLAGGGDMDKATYDVLADSIVDGDNTAYGVGWNGSINAASKDAIYDKIETLAAFDSTAVIGNTTWGDGSTDTIVWTWNRATGTDPTITFNSGSLGFQAFTSAGSGSVGTYFDITPTATQAHSEGRMYYDSDVNTYVMYNAESDVSLNVGEETWVFVRNATGSTITDGQVVYFSGSSGGKPKIVLAKADVAATSFVKGIATHDIENNSNGYVTVFGVVRGAVNTSGLSGGDPLYLSAATAGAVTTTAPTPPNFIVMVANVMTVGASGDVFVCPQIDYTDGVVVNSLNTVGDLTIHGDDLFMGTNTDRFVLVGDGTNYNPEVMNLGTDTTGNYVATIADAGDSLITVANSGTETAAVTLTVTADSLDFTELSDAMTLDASTQISFGSNSLTYQIANPGSDAFEINGTGAFTADLLHVHQHTGNPTGGMLAHFESVDTDITPQVHIHQDKADIDAAVVGFLIDAVDDDDSSWTPLEIRDDSDNNNDLLFTIDYTGAASASSTITATGSFIIGSADLNEADMEKLDGITNGTAAANKALVLGASGEIGTITTATMTNASITTATITNNIKNEPKHMVFNIINPLATQTEDNEICLWPVTPAALTVTKIVVTLNSAANEVAGDLKYADTFIGLANPVVINVFDTSSGILSDDSITSGAVAAGKAIYIAFDSAPDTAITQMCVDITWDFD